MSESASKEVRHKIQELSESIKDHQFQYYVNDKPSITDAAFDKLWQELIELERKYQIGRASCRERV